MLPAVNIECISEYQFDLEFTIDPDIESDKGAWWLLDEMSHKSFGQAKSSNITFMFDRQ